MVVLYGAPIGNDGRPPLLEFRSGHPAVLKREEAEQAAVDELWGPERSCRSAAIDRLGHRNVADEGDGIEKDAEKEQVAYEAVEECEASLHGSFPAVLIRIDSVLGS